MRTRLSSQHRKLMDRHKKVTSQVKNCLSSDEARLIYEHTEQGTVLNPPDISNPREHEEY